MALNTPFVTDEELQQYADILRRSGKYHLYQTVSSTPVMPNLTRESLNTPEREYVARHSTGADIIPGTGAYGSSKTEIPSIHGQDRRSSYFSDRPSVRYSLPPRYSDDVLEDNIPPPVPPPPSRQSSLSYVDSFSQPFHYSSPRVPKLPPFSGESKDDCAFDLWKYEINCLIRNRVYPEHILLESIRMSLKGKARTVLLHLGDSASAQDILTELEGIYGNVSSSEKLKEKFYCAQQEPSESIADYSLRLEQLLSKSTLKFDLTTKNEMLCGRLWAGLFDKELRKASRYKFESIHDYGVLRRELRKMEQDLHVGRKGPLVSPPPVANQEAAPPQMKPPEPQKPPDSSVQPATQFTSSVENKLLQQLQDLKTQMKQLNTRVGTVEKELQNLKKSRNYQGGYHDRNKWGDRNKEEGSSKEAQQKADQKEEDKQKPLNHKGPSQ